MERNLNHDDFDQFLKENADGLRMHPSDRIWQNISRELDRKRRRMAGWFALSLLLVSGIYITYEIGSSTQRQQLALRQPAPTFSLARKVAPPYTSTPVAITPANNEVALRSPKAQTTIRLVKKPVAPPASLIADAPLGNEPVPESILTITPAAPPEAAIADLATSPQLQETDLRKATPIALMELPAPSRTLGLPTQEEQDVTTAPQVLEPATEMAVAPIRKTPKVSWQIFATPTISYRVLSDNKSYRRPLLTPNIPANFSALYGINDAVIHKPDLGLEFGVMARYAVSKSVKLRTGFQFNVSRYDIKAFSFVPEVATIALSNGFGVDSVRAISNYRNFAGGRTNWLQNFYFQASMPVGLEVKVAGNDKMHWGVASSIQPTYLIGNRSYMITADYKNYARVPWLSRRWNMNTSFETFVSINSGKTQWQVGPQVRYQVLSSFIREYPVKENLFDFGLKVGVTLK